MANINFKPDLNQPVPNGPIRTYPWLTTLTPNNQTGYKKLYPNLPSTEVTDKLEYAVQTNGVVTFRVVDEQGNVRRQFNSIQEMADSGYNFGFNITPATITQLKQELNLELYYSNDAIIKGKKSPSPYFTGTVPGLGQGQQPPPPPGPPGSGAGGAPTAGSASDSANNTTTKLDVNPLAQIPEEVFGIDKFNSYKYPLDTIDRGQDNIVFTQLKYVRTGVTQTETQFKELETPKKILGTVTLPMPNDISETNNVGWGEDSLSNAAAAFMPGLTSAALNFSGGDVKGLANDVGNLFNLLKNNDALSMRIRQSVSTKIAASILQKASINVNPESYISRATGAAINPNMELLFNGPKLRQFAFQFKMTPRSQDEAKQIRGILRFFKKGMSPRRTKDSNYSFYLGTPNIFKIRFKSRNDELNSIGKIKTCALVSFAANYTPDGFYAAYADDLAGGSQPIAVTIQMAFTELTPVFSDEYASDQEDGEVIDIGPNKFDVDYNLKETPVTGSGRNSGGTGTLDNPKVGDIKYLGRGNGYKWTGTVWEPTAGGASLSKEQFKSRYTNP